MRFVACWELGAGYGHLVHLASIARALVRQGHEVVLVSRDATLPRRLFGGLFAAILQAPRAAACAPSALAVTYAQVIGDSGIDDPAAGPALIEAWLDLFALLRPDGVIAEHAPVALLASHVAELPAALIGNSFMVPPLERPFPSLQPWREIGVEERRAADARADAAVAALCTRFAAPPLDGVAALLAGAARVLLTWPELDHYGPQPHARYAGPLEPLRGSARAEWPRASGPRVLVYLPTAHATALALAEGLARLGWPALWHSRQPPRAPMGDNVRFTAEPVDLDDAMAEARLFIHRAGTGAGAVALRMGCPQLLLPDMLETLLAARRLGASGVARVLPSDSSGEHVAAAIQAMVADAAVARAAAGARARYGGYDAAAAATRVAAEIVGHVQARRG